MSTQRYIDTSFWDDSWVQELDPSEKLLYIYLLTNPLTNIAGVMELTVKRICFDTGFNSDTVTHILRKFEDAKKVYRYNNFIIIRNFPKHQQLKSDNVIKGIAAILCKLPDDLLCYLEEIGYQFDIKGTFDTLCIPYTYPSHYLNSNLNSNSDLNSDLNKPEKKKTTKNKKESLRNREPENNFECVEKAYIELWDSLYSQKKVNTPDPLITSETWKKIRRLEKGLFDNNIPVEVIKNAVKKAAYDNFVINNGYAFDLILSGNVINRLINGSVQNNQQQSNKSNWYDSKNIGKAESDRFTENVNESDIPF